MSTSVIMSLIALVASILLMLQPNQRWLGTLPAVFATLGVLRAFGIVSFGVRGMSVPVILGSGLAITGTLLFLRANTKLSVAAATTAGLIGVIQVLRALFG